MAVTALLMKVEMECGVVKALPTVYGEVSYRGLSRLRKLHDKKATAVVEASSPSDADDEGEGKGLWSFDLRRASEQVGAGRETLLRQMHVWEHDGVVEIDNLGVAARYEVVRALPETVKEVDEVVERVHGVVKMHKRQSLERRDRVLELVAGRECFVGVLAEYFGDGEVVGRGGCGHCQWCLDRKERRGGRERRGVERGRVKGEGVEKRGARARSK